MLMKTQVLRMLTAIGLALFAALPLRAAEPADAQAAASGPAASGTITSSSSAPASYEWRSGPLQLDLLDQATLKLPAGYAWLDQQDARRMLQQLGNPNVTDVLGLVTGKERDWLLVVRFDKDGFIKNEDAGKWNADALLESIRKGAVQTNQQRQKQQVPEIEILGWLEQPKYDAAQHRLSWGIGVRNQGDEAPEAQGLNYNTYLLGREGYFSLNLITSLQEIERNKQHAAVLVAVINFRDGKRYADFADVDKLAPYGLSKLLAGATDAAVGKKTAKAAQAKKGFFANYGKLIFGIVLVLVLAVGGGLAWMFLRRRKGAAEPEAKEPSMEEGASPEAAKT